MNLFIDTISCPAFLILFDKDRIIKDEFSWDARMQESSTLIPNIKNLLIKNSLKFENLKNIIIVSGPWSFTWVRTTSLVWNTISFLNPECKITDITYFDLFKKYPIIKKSSKRDSFVKLKEDSEIIVVMNTDLKDYIKTDYAWEYNNFLEEKNISEINYSEIIKETSFKNKNIISPFYMKKPNIT